MKTTLVTDPSHVVMDPAAHPWLTRLKYTTPFELLYDYEASNADMGRQHCPVAEYIRSHLDDDIVDVETYIYSHEEWGPTALCESVQQTIMFNHATSHPHGEFIAAWAQHYCLLTLRKYHGGQPRLRWPFDAMLKHWRTRFMSPAVASTALGILRDHHPNPVAFLQKPEVAAKFAPFQVKAAS